MSGRSSAHFTAPEGTRATVGRQDSGRRLRVAAGAGMLLGSVAATLTFIVLNSRWHGWQPGAAPTLLMGTLPGALAGAAVGVAVWLTRTRQEVGVLRLMATRGLIGAGAAVLALALLGVVVGLVIGFSIGPAGADPGVEAAWLAAFALVVVEGVPAALLGFGLGACIALLVRRRRNTSDGGNPSGLG